MTSYIMHSILTKLNSQMKAQSHNILLFLDGAGCHLSDLVVPGRYSNIKIVFFPPNITSMLQPLDLGIIKNLNVYYRQFLLRYVCAQIEESSTANEISNSSNCNACNKVGGTKMGESVFDYNPKELSESRHSGS